MGIDIYARWANQTEAEQSAQLTGFSVVHGHAGYLREAYHGGPYVTKFLVREAFEAKHGEAAIPAAVLRERLPAAVLLALYREQKVYGKGTAEPLNIELGQAEGLDKLKRGLEHIFAVEITDTSHEQLVRLFDEDKLKLGRTLIEQKLLPDYAQSFVDFVSLCEQKERETGQPCLIEASW